MEVIARLGGKREGTTPLFLPPPQTLVNRNKRNTTKTRFRLKLPSGVLPTPQLDFPGRVEREGKRKCRLRKGEKRERGKEWGRTRIRNRKGQGGRGREIDPSVISESRCLAAEDW